MTTLAMPRAAAPSPRALTFASLAVLYVVWSSTYLALRHVVSAMPPMLAGGARFLVAGALLFALQRARGEPGPARADWRPAALSGALLFALGNGLLGVAETRVASGVAAVACAVTPLFVALLGAAWGERPTARELAGIALGFAGVAVLGAGSLSSAGAQGLALLVSPFAWALGTVIARRARPRSSVTFAAQQMVAGGAAMLALGAALGEGVPREVPAAAWLGIGWLVVFGSVVAYPAYAFLVQNARPAVATSYAYVNPVLAVVLGSALGGEALAPTTVGALGMVLAAVLVVVTRKATARGGG